MHNIKRLPHETKDNARLRAQTEREAHQRAYDAFMRERCTYWLFWEMCGSKRCLRHRACVGNVERCFDRFRPLVAPSSATGLSLRINPAATPSR